MHFALKMGTFIFTNVFLGDEFNLDLPVKETNRDKKGIRIKGKGM